MDKSLIKLKCYEPAGQSIEISQRELLEHTLVLGGTGAGKTTRVIYPAVSQLITNKERHLSLCIFDSKDDGAFARLFEDVQGAASLVINPYSDNCLDIVSPLRNRGLEGIETVAGLISSCVPRDLNNRYWEMTFESLIRQATRLYALSENDINYESFVAFLMRYLLHHQLKDPDAITRIEQLKSLSKSCDKRLATAIDETVAAHRMWDTLEHRTRSILQSMAAPVCSSLNSSEALQLFSKGDPVSIDESIKGGRSILLSIDAIRHPEAARLAGTVFKGQFYDAVLRGKHMRDSTLAGLVLDDWSLVADGSVHTRYSDVDALAMIRSRGGFILASCQSLAALDLTIGETARRAIVANFGNIFFMRSRDMVLDAMAASYLGKTKDILVDKTIREVPSGSRKKPGDPIVIQRESRVPSVPVGALAQMAVGDVYALIGSRIYNKPMCLVPTYA